MRGRCEWQDRAHFLGISARLMRRVLVDHARTRDARKRGDGDYKVALDENIAASESPEVDLVDLDRAWRRWRRSTSARAG